MGSIERFREKLRRVRKEKGKSLHTKKGQEEIANALAEIKEVEKNLDWMPKPEKPGNGVIGEGTKRMSRGGLP